jgi:hypothetical protein
MFNNIFTNHDYLYEQERRREYADDNSFFLPSFKLTKRKRTRKQILHQHELVKKYLEGLYKDEDFLLKQSLIDNRFNTLNYQLLFRLYKPSLAALKKWYKDIQNTRIPLNSTQNFDFKTSKFFTAIHIYTEKIFIKNFKKGFVNSIVSEFLK